MKRALVFLGLIKKDGSPEENLEKLIKAEGEERKAIISEIVSCSYVDLLAQVDLERATAKQLQDYFKSIGADGKIGQMCISFFLALAREAGPTECATE